MGKYDEDRLCQGIYHWFGIQYPKIKEFMHHLSNERNTAVKLSKNGRYYSPAGKKLQAMGQQKGMPDYVLFVPVDPYPGLFFEVKVIHKSFDYESGKQIKNKTYPNEDQRKKLVSLYEMGYAVDVVWTLRQAIDLVSSYMKGEYEPSEYFTGMLQRETEGDK